MKLVVGLEGASKPEVESFDFGASLVTKKDLGLFVKWKWYAKGNARVLEGEYGAVAARRGARRSMLACGSAFNDWPRR
jgi:hypothetical protein